MPDPIDTYLSAAEQSGMMTTHEVICQARWGILLLAMADRTTGCFDRGLVFKGPDLIQFYTRRRAS